MLQHEPEEEISLPISQEQIARQELEEETLTLQQQRRDLNDQRALLDLERAELEQQLAALKLKNALLDALSTRLDQQEAMLASDYEAVRMTGKRSRPRLSRER